MTCTANHGLNLGDSQISLRDGGESERGLYLVQNVLKRNAASDAAGAEDRAAVHERLATDLPSTAQERLSPAPVGGQRVREVPRLHHLKTLIRNGRPSMVGFATFELATARSFNPDRLLLLAVR